MVFSCCVISASSYKSNSFFQLSPRSNTQVHPFSPHGHRKTVPRQIEPWTTCEIVESPVALVWYGVSVKKYGRVWLDDWLLKRKHGLLWDFFGGGVFPKRSDNFNSISSNFLLAFHQFFLDRLFCLGRVTICTWVQGSQILVYENATLALRIFHGLEVRI